MSAVPQSTVSPASFGPGTRLEPMESTAAPGLRVRPLLGILTAFWLYVMLSNVLYAQSMQYFLTLKSSTDIFASWDSRVVQHLLLYPALLGCIMASMRIGWRPAWRAWPAQVMLGLVFSALGTPALLLAQLCTHESDWKSHPDSHTLSDFWKGPDPALWLSSATNFLLAYGFCVALVTGFTMYQRYRDSQLRVAALERAWSTARLATLRMQLSPHTLFNLLHTIRGQIGWDPQKAQAMVVQLGDLLRRLLSAGERDFSRLSDELHFTYSYLDLQRQRFPDRLTLHFPEVEVLPTVWVPSLILQPLVENAVVHGLSGHEGPVSIRIEIDARAEQLQVRILNTVVPERPVGGEGVGLRNVRERLAVQFGDKARLEAGPVSGDEWCVSLQIPLLRDGPASSAPNRANLP